MDFLARTVLSETEKLEIIELWNNEYPARLSYESAREFDAYLEGLTDRSHLLLIDSDGKVRGWYFDFMRDGERWFAMILDAGIQGKGFGRQFLNLAKEKEAELNAWVVDHDRDLKKNGEIYRSPLDFYLKNGFEKIAESRLESDKISAVKIHWKK